MITKAELEDISRGSENPKLRVTSRVSSEVCDLVPVKHEKAEAALTAFGTIVERKKLPVPPQMLTRESIVGSLLRPHRTYSMDSVNLFEAGTAQVSHLEALTGLASKTLKNVRKKGRINAYTAGSIARVALAAKMLEVLTKEQLAAFQDHSLIKRLFEGKPVFSGTTNLASNRDARHSLLNKFLVHCKKVSSVSDGNEALELAKKNLRDFFTTDYQAFSPVIIKGADESYLVDGSDQIPAPMDWRTWS